eukprot:GFYU01001092.1.p1 GENE.GFYU01001092.1~~GFYU01001092.1.p1  ORF type:complete len:416 (+),score=91.47 GFYU01001092.1:116-1249(+)
MPVNDLVFEVPSTLSQWVADMLACKPTLLVQLSILPFFVMFWAMVREILLPVSRHVIKDFQWFRRLSNTPWLLSEDGGFDTQDGWVAWLYTSVHHVVGGGLMLMGYANIRPDLFRWGTLISVCGVDLLDILYIFLGRAPYDIIRDPKNGEIIPLIFAVFAHHLCSIAAFLPTNLYYSDVPEFQLLGFALLGGGGILGCIGLVQNMFDSSTRSGNAMHVVLMIPNFFAFLYCRFYLFPTSGYTLLSDIYGEGSYGFFGLFLGGCLFLTLFNVVAVALQTAGLVREVRKFVANASAARQKKGNAPTVIDTAMDTFQGLAAQSPKVITGMSVQGAGFSPVVGVVVRDFLERRPALVRWQKVKAASHFVGAHQRAMRKKDE